MRWERVAHGLTIAAAAACLALPGVCRADAVADALLQTEVTGVWELWNPVYGHGGYGGAGVIIKPGPAEDHDFENGYWPGTDMTIVSAALGPGDTPHGEAHASAMNPGFIDGRSASPQDCGASAGWTLNDTATAGDSAAWVDSVAYLPSGSGEVAFTAELDYDIDLSAASMDGHLLAWVAFWSVEPEDGRVRTELLLEETDLWRRGNVSPDWYLEDQLLRLVQVPEGEERIAVEMPSWSVTVDRDRAYWAAAGLYVGTTEEYLARLTSGMSSAVSEPATGLLLALGLSALAVKRAKR